MKKKYAVGDKVRFTSTRGGYIGIKDTGIVVRIGCKNLVECEVTYQDGSKDVRNFFLTEIAGKID